MTRLLMIVIAEVVAVVATHQLAAPYREAVSWEWLTGASVETLLGTVLHVAAAAGTWWLLAGTLHDVVVTARSMHRRCTGGALAPTERRLAPLWIQRVVNQGLGTLLVVGMMAGPAGAATQVEPSTSLQQVVGPPVPILELPTRDQPPPAPLAAPSAEEITPPSADEQVPTGPTVTEEMVLPPILGGTPPSDSDDPGVAGDPGAASPDAATQEPDVVTQDDVIDPPGSDATEAADTAGSTDPAQHTVAVGENLWVIARATLAGNDGALPTDRAVHGYWISLIEANDFRSGDPDLIVPGEFLILPAVPSGASS